MQFSLIGYLTTANGFSSYTVVRFWLKAACRGCGRLARLSVSNSWLPSNYTASLRTLSFAKCPNAAVQPECSRQPERDGGDQRNERPSI